MTPKRLIRFFAALTLASCMSSEVLAAPFCAVFSYGKQCYYYSLDACQEAAGESGACVVNDEEVQAPAHGAPFCVVQSFGAQCFYYDAGSCRQAAASSGGACVVNPNS